MNIELILMPFIRTVPQEEDYLSREIRGKGYIHPYGVQICYDHGRDRFYPWHRIETVLRIQSDIEDNEKNLESRNKQLEQTIRELEEKIESMARMAVDTFTPFLPLEDSSRSENQKNEPADKLEAATKPVLGKEKEDGQGYSQRTANY